MNANVNNAQIVKDLEAYNRLIETMDPIIDSCIEAYNKSNPKIPIIGMNFQPNFDGRLMVDNKWVARFSPDLTSIVPIDPPVDVLASEYNYLGEIAIMARGTNKDDGEEDQHVEVPLVNPQINQKVDPAAKPQVDVEIKPHTGNPAPPVDSTNHVIKPNIDQPTTIVKQEQGKKLSRFQETMKRNAELALANKNKHKFKAYQPKNKTVTKYEAGSVHQQITYNYMILPGAPNHGFGYPDVPQGNTNMLPAGIPTIPQMFSMPGQKATSRITTIEEVYDHEDDTRVDNFGRTIRDPRAYMQIPENIKVYSPMALARYLKKPQDRFFINDAIAYYDYYRSQPGVEIDKSQDYRVDYKKTF